MRTGKVKIIGGRPGQQPLRGQDIAVVLELSSGEEVLVPALSLVLRVGSRHEQAVATVEVPAVLVDIKGVELRAEAVVAPGGPQSQWEEALGNQPNLRTANADEYTEPHLVVPPSANELPLAVVAQDPAESMAELDRIIAAGGKVPDPS